MRRLPLVTVLVLLFMLTPTVYGQEDGAADQFLDQLVASLTPTEKVGQLVMVEFMGYQVAPDSPIAGLIRDYKVGAVHYNSFNCNITNRKDEDPTYCAEYGFPEDAEPDTAAQVASLSNALQSLACQSVAGEVDGRPFCLPLLIAIDHEGDDRPLTHLRNHFTPVPSQMAIGAAWDEKQAEAVGCIAGSELASVGINVLLGPVADVLENPRSGSRGDVGVRVFGGDASWVGKFSRAYIRGVHQCGQGRVLTVTKHFPGHGGSTRAIEDEVAVVPKSLDELRRLELVPFAEVARLDSNDGAGVTDAMMTSHLRYPRAQGSATAPPVSLDAQALGQFMALSEFSSWREGHLLMADALGVRALRRLEPEDEPFPHCDVAKTALMAGNDLLPLVPWYSDEAHQNWERYQVPNIKDTIDCLAREYSLDPSFRRRVDGAVRRVVSAKLALYPGLSADEALVDSQRAAEAVGGGRDDVYDLALDALTLIHPSSQELRERLPRGPTSSERILFIECWSDSRCCWPALAGGSLERLTLRFYGPGGGGQVSPGNVATMTFGDLDDLLDGELEQEEEETVRDLIEEADWLVFALADYNPDRRPASGALKKFLASSLYGQVVAKKLVVIAYNSPYHLDATEVSKLTAYFGVYSKSEPFKEVSIRALFQDLTSFPGAPPVDVEGAAYSLAYQLQPDPARAVPLTLELPEAGAVVGEAIQARAGPILDRNGNPIPDGGVVEFGFEGADGGVSVLSVASSDGLATAEYTPQVGGQLDISARSGNATSDLKTVEVQGPPGQQPTATPTATPGGDGEDFPWLLAVVPPVAVLGLGAGAVGLLLYRRRRPPAVAAAEARPKVLHVDTSTRRIFVEGRELLPPPSGEQYRLLAFLYENAGQLCSKDDIVRRVWPDVEAEGVSDEAIDSLVHRVRERLRQAGVSKAVIVTIRGEGFRLDL